MLPLKRQFEVGCVLFLLILASSPARGQEKALEGPVVYRIDGRELTEHLGEPLAVLGDVDGDAVNDFAATAEDRNSKISFGKVSLFSGKTGSLLRVWYGEDGPHSLRGAMGAVGDLDGDRIFELGVSSGIKNIDVLSPVTGKRWYRVPSFADRSSPANVILRVPDADGDGIEDFLFTVPTFNTSQEVGNAGAVSLYSGRKGDLLWRRLGLNEDGYFGASAISAGDHDGDGVDDILVGEAGSLWTIFESPAVHVLSARTGEVLRTFHLGEEYREFGSTMASLGDLDGDGFPEVAIGAPGYGTSATPDTGSDRGWVGIFHMPDFRLERSFAGRDPKLGLFKGDRLGYNLTAVGDMDGDGITDLLIGTGRSFTAVIGYWYGRLYLHSGASGEVLAVYEGLQSGDPFFQALSPLGDVDGDGKPEFLVGSPCEDKMPDPREELLLAGSIRVLRYADGGTRFLRGDTNADGVVNISDAVVLMRALLENTSPSCPAAFDVGGDGSFSSQDLLSLLYYLFLPWMFSPAPPFPECGIFLRIEPVKRVLPCDDPGSCRGG